MESHGGSGLQVSEFEEPGAHVGVVVEKPEEFVLELGELLLAGEACIVFHVVVEEMDGFWFEELS